MESPTAGLDIPDIQDSMRPEAKRYQHRIWIVTGLAIAGATMLTVAFSTVHNAYEREEQMAGGLEYANFLLELQIGLAESLAYGPSDSKAPPVSAGPPQSMEGKSAQTTSTMLGHLYESSNVSVYPIALNPAGPQRPLDTWEKAAMHSILRGSDGESGMDHTVPSPVIRAIRPLVATKNCLRCHENEKFRVGETVGALSAKVNTEYIAAATLVHGNKASVIHWLIWAATTLCALLAGTVLVRMNRQRELSERQNQQNSAYLHAILESIPYQVNVLDAEYRLLSSNRSAFPTVPGRRIREGMSHCYEIFHGRTAPCEGPDLVCPLNEALKSRACTTATHEHLGPDGVIRTYEIDVSPMASESGDIDRFIEIIRDVTDRAAIERQLRTMAQVIEHVHDAVIYVTPTGRISAWNKGATALFGFLPGEVIGTFVFSLFHADCRHRVKKAALQAIRHGDWQIEANVLHRSGREIQGYMSVSSITDKMGKVIGGIAIILDISKLREVEQKLAESSDRYQLAVESAELGTWDWDLVSGNAKVNARYAAMLGYEHERFEHSFDRFKNMAHPDDLPHVLEGIEVNMLAGDSISEDEVRLRHKDGHWIWFLNRGRVVERDRTGRPLRACGIMQDISEKKNFEAELKNSIELLTAIRASHEAAFSTHAEGIPYNRVLASILKVSDSAFGFVGKVAWDGDTPKWLEMLAIDSAQWDKDAKTHYQTAAVSGDLRLDMNTHPLIEPLLAGKPTLSNTPNAPDRRTNGTGAFAGFRNFLAVPIQQDGKTVLLFGLANRPTPFTYEIAQRLMPLLETLTQVTMAASIDAERKRHREQLERIVTAIEDGTWEWDLTSDQIMWSDRSFHILGYASQEFALDYKTWSDLIHPTDRDMCIQTLLHSLETGQPFKMEFRYKTKAGSWCWVNSRGRIVERNDAGWPTRMAGAHTDISDRKRSEWRIRSRLSINDYARNHSLRELMVRVLDEAEALTESTIGFCHFVEPDQEHVWLQAWSTNTTETMCHAEGGGKHYPISYAGVWADSIRDRRPMIHNDYYALPNRRGLPLGHAEVTRQLVVPVMRDDKVVAVMGVGNKPTPYTDQDLADTVALADLAWDTIQVKQAEQAHREAEALYKSMFSQNNAIMLLVDPETGAIAEANPAACMYYGYTYDEIVAMTAADIDVDSSGELAKLFQAVLQRNANAAHSIRRHQVQSGEIRDVEVFATALAKNGRDVVFMIIHDITDRRRAEEERARLAMAVEQATEAIVITGVDGSIEYVNPAFERVTGYAEAEVVGKNPRVLKSHVHPKEFYEEMWSAITSGETWHGQITNVRKTGESFTEDVVISPLRDSSGVVRHFVGVKRDITRELQLQSELRQSQRLESVGRLAGGVAHDFNNLLQIIGGYTQLMLDQGGSAHAFHDMLTEVNRASGRAAELVSQLLAFSRKSVMRFQNLDMKLLVQSWTKGLGRVLGENAQLVVECDSETSVAYADRGMMEQVLMNLCVNARDAMPRGGVVSICTGSIRLSKAFANDNPWAKEGHFAYLKVADTGEGMSRGIIEHIFEPFFTTKGPGEGTGLGLATVHGIVQQHGGFIHVSSEINRGSVFTVYVPAAHTDIAQVKHLEQKRITGRSETILVAEDEPGIRQFSKKVLEAAGYHVVLACDGMEAMEQLSAHKAEIALIVLDVIMPHMSGREVFEKIQSTNNAIPVIFATGYSESSLHSEVNHGSELRLIRKPFSKEDLLEAVRSALDATPADNAALNWVL
ncbi:MAG: hypothetical protein AMXMBFR84_24110 [Candidatus Hydrogenedentota bacterium]